MLQVVLPQLCFDDEDAELWEDDPQEFVRKVGGCGNNAPGCVIACAYHGRWHHVDMTAPS